MSFSTGPLRTNVKGLNDQLELIYTFFTVTVCSLEDLSEAMDDRDEWRERDREIRANSTTWWWWWWYTYIYVYIYIIYIEPGSCLFQFHYYLADVAEVWTQFTESGSHAVYQSATRNPISKNIQEEFLKSPK